MYRGPSAPSFPAPPTGIWDGRASGLRQIMAALEKEVPAGTRDAARPGAASPGIATNAERDAVGAEIAATSDASREVRAPSWQAALRFTKAPTTPGRWSRKTQCGRAASTQRHQIDERRGICINMIPVMASRE